MITHVKSKSLTSEQLFCSPFCHGKLARTKERKLFSHAQNLSRPARVVNFAGIARKKAEVQPQAQEKQAF
jgi:hypothetical protein